jgi:phage-related protein
MIKGLPDAGKPVRWVGSSLEDLRRLPKSAKIAVGFELVLLKQEEEPTDYVYMASVGNGAYKIRVSEENGRVYWFMCTILDGAIYVLHSFPENSSVREQEHISLARERMKAVAGNS